MTDRVQPGALGSRTYPMEVGDAVGQFSPGWIVPASDPTLSAERWAGIDETAFTEFDATYGGGSLDVDIGPGEAFVSGWLARDISTTITLAASTAGQTIVLGWNPDATYDDQVHATRDEADEVFISLESDAQDDDPYVPIWEFDTDDTGVTSVTDHRNIGPTLGDDVEGAGADTVDMGTITLSTGDAPAYDGTLQSVVENEDTLVEDIIIYPDSEGQVANDYAVNHDYGVQWDDANRELDVNLTVNWDTDPGSDMTYRVEAVLP